MVNIYEMYVFQKDKVFLRDYLQKHSISHSIRSILFLSLVLDLVTSLRFTDFRLTTNE